MDTLSAGLVLFAAALLLLLTWIRRKSVPRWRPIDALTRLYRAVGLSVEDGTRLLVGLGSASLLTKTGAAALAGLGVLREIAKRTSVGDSPPVAAAGESALALLGQDVLQAGYKAAGAAEFYQPTTGRLTGMTPFSSAVGTIPMLSDEDVSAAVLIGHFGVESALLADAAERNNILLVGSTDDPSAQAALYSSATEALLGEELFGAPAYLGAGPTHAASLTVQDVLRWLFILAILAGVALKLLGRI
jgi:hypothetical protein